MDPGSNLSASAGGVVHLRKAARYLTKRSTRGAGRRLGDLRVKCAVWSHSVYKGIGVYSGMWFPLATAHTAWFAHALSPGMPVPCSIVHTLVGQVICSWPGKSPITCSQACSLWVPCCLELGRFPGAHSWVGFWGVTSSFTAETGANKVWDT